MQFIIPPLVLLAAVPLTAARYSPLLLRARADGRPLYFNGTTLTVTQPAPTSAPITITVVRPVPTETVTATVTATVTVTQTPPPQQLYAVSKASAAYPQPDPCEEPADFSSTPEQPHRLYVTKTILLAPNKFKQPGTVTVLQSGSANAASEVTATTVTVRPVPAVSSSLPEKFETIVKTAINSPEPAKEPAAVTSQPEQEVEPVATVVFDDPCPSVTTNTAAAFNTVLATFSRYPIQNVTAIPSLNTTAATLPGGVAQSSGNQPPAVRSAPVRRRW
ncbi:hypothetical protein ISF_02931 [Cordyceps fumosorosea ARSEF 2679]|uniref:Uncharacterized protein n=1 Tax=Cordyceps fumosorosea (strain ARSEF 2679) TaxID=1081104 RepID=A0A168B5W0_CORFA|nr:hypothetical protein ISF_02931 [Cordyceps fumosorosea ARSEF 2679]OAA69661.1 hypothetical protein ISF_02931 [Cordyceps fumosorosea ARSEF 2679]